MLVVISIMFICMYLFDLDGVSKILDEEYLLLFSIKGTESIVVKNVKEDIPQISARQERQGSFLGGILDVVTGRNMPSAEEIPEKPAP